MRSTEPQKPDKKVIGFNDSRSNVVYLNIGGTHFQTFEHTLTKFDSIFRQIFLLKDPTPLYDKNGRLYFDRSPKYFRMILKTLQNEETEVEIQEKYYEQEKVYLENEINYYGFQNSLYVKSFVPPEPPGPTLKERFVEFMSNFRHNLSQVISSGVGTYVYNNKQYLEEMCLGSIFLYLVLFTVLLFFVSIGLINNRVNILFWPFYGISISFLGIKMANYIYDRHSGYHDLGAYLFGLAINAAVTFSFSFLFSKVYYWYHDLNYYRWWVVNFIPMLASLIGMGITLFYTIGHQISYKCKNLIHDCTLENITIVSVPFTLFWTVWSLNLYMDDVYFKRISLLLIPLMIHVGMGILLGYSNINKGYFNFNEEEIVRAFCKLGYAFNWMIISSLIGFHGIFSVLPFTIMSILTLNTGMNLN